MKNERILNYRNLTEKATDGGSQVSALKWSKGAPLNLG